MKLIDIIYDYNEGQLEAYIEVGASGGWYSWKIDVIELAELLGLNVVERVQRVDYGDGRGEDILSDVFIEGEFLEFFFFTEYDLQKAVGLLYSQLN